MSRTWLGNGIMLCLCLVFFNLSHAQLLWKATPPSQGPVIYLFGTMHVGIPNYLNDHPVLKQYIDSCDCLITETSTELEGVAELVYQYALLPDGIKLSDSLTEREWQKLDSLLASMGNTFISAEVINALKPIYAQIIMAALNVGIGGDSLGLDGSVDVSIQQYCKGKGMLLRYFETQQQQLGFLFNDIPLSSQFNMLRKSLADGAQNKKMEDYMLRLPEIYKSQNLDSLQMIIHSTELNSIEEDIMYLNLLDKRNEQWMTHLLGLDSSETRNVFVAVGAAHLIGEFGLIELLRKNGFIVNPVPYD